VKDPTPLQYENRKGTVYYLHEGQTRAGKPRYYTSRKLTGKPLAALPEGYEFYERPETAQVVVRKIKSSPITEFERKLTEEIVRRASGLRHFVVDVEEDALIVYTPSLSRAEADDLSKLVFGPIPGLRIPIPAGYRERRIKSSLYVKMLRFELVDPDTRAYRAERWCFRGSIDDWILLPASGPLSELVEKYAKHLDQESFYDLM
jgi:hypothetical protein